MDQFIWQTVLWIHGGNTVERCPLCGSESGSLEECRGRYFGDVLAREYTSLSGYGRAHLLTVDCYALQHSEDHGPRSNALHLVRLGWLLNGGEADISQKNKGPIPHIMENYYREFPYLLPPPAARRGSLTIMDLYNARSVEEHISLSYKWARSVWDAYEAHHAWAIGILKKAGIAVSE